MSTNTKEFGQFYRLHERPCSPFLQVHLPKVQRPSPLQSSGQSVVEMKYTFELYLMRRSSGGKGGYTEVLKHGLNVLKNCSVHLSVPMSSIVNSLYTRPSIAAAAYSIRERSFIMLRQASKNLFLALYTSSEKVMFVSYQNAPP
jgi:hypothetical protein